MKIGDYIRNKYGIAKIIDIKTNEYGIDICYLDNDIAFVLDNKTKEEKWRTSILPLTDNVDISKIKHSPNIIDLIEVGDYVNGSKVLSVTIYGVYIEDGTTYGNTYIEAKDIKSIVTKEQFENMEYKL